MSRVMYILDIEALKKIYHTGTEYIDVLQEIDLQVVTGTTVLITGESGSGKSTLLNMIGGLDAVTSGKIIVNNMEITSMSEEELTSYRNRVIGFIFQFHYLLKDFSALENIMMPCLIANLSFRQSKQLALQLLSDIGLESRKNHYPYQLSGGERQRVAVARAIINNPELILADEPTGNLDERNSELVLNILFELVQKYRKTMIMVTHEVGIIDKVDESYLLEHGALVKR